MPGVDVYRPADAVETAEAWEAALCTTDRPSVLCLSRQAVSVVRQGTDHDNPTDRGAYLLVDPGPDRDLTILATGSEVGLACEAAEQLEAQGVAAAVVSMPSWERFERQSADYQQAVLGDGPRIAVEAACRFGWDRWLGADPTRTRFVGMEGFGASGPADDLYHHFGITVERIVAEAQDLTDRREDTP
jgi:transketolase